MSKLQKKNKISINLQSSGAFLNLNKPKLISIGNSFDKKKLKLKVPLLNISQESFPMENIKKITQNNSKDEVIRILVDRLSNLEKKVKILEKDNSGNSSKINSLNLSHGNPQKKISILPKGLKLNMKLSKKRKQYLKVLGISKNGIKGRNINNIKTILNNSNSNYKNSNTIEGKSNDNNNNKSRNFFNSINTNQYNTNNTNSNSYFKNNKNNYKIKISNSVSKYKFKRYTILPESNSKKKFFINVLRKTMNKNSTIDIEKNKNNNDSNNNIPKVPRKGKQHKSEIIKTNSSKLINGLKTPYSNKKLIPVERNESEINMNNSNGNTDNKYEKKEYNIRIIKNNNDTDNNEPNFHNIKDKLENIKIRTKNLLEYFSSKKKEKEEKNDNGFKKLKSVINCDINNKYNNEYINSAFNYNNYTD